MVLYVVRHGQTEANEKHLFNGINKLDLTDKGIKQIEELIPKINNLNIDIIICSPLIRATHTANILNTKNKEIIIDDRLIERECGKYTLKPTSLIDNKEELYNKNNNKYQDFESFSSIIERVNNFIEDIKVKYNNEKVLIITHGDVILGFQEYFDRRSDGYLKTGNISIFELDSE